jgi:hypothetical protein
MTHNGIEITSVEQIALLDETQSTKDFLIAALLDRPYTQPTSPQYEEEVNYVKRQEDGVRAYLSITSELRILQKAGYITREHNRAIEDTLQPVRNEIVLGQWKTAMEKLVEIGVTNTVTESMYQRFYSILDNYLTGPMYA